MIIYADSSFIVASRYRWDNFHTEALKFYDGREEDAWLWSPWHRAEVFTAVRQYARATGPKRGMTEADARAIIHRLENEVRLGYFLHMEADWRDVLRQFNELSAEHSFKIPFGSADLLHVAYALELSAELFVTFDKEQVALAQVAGLKVANPAGDWQG
jgi:predicted nucleic acid-binding protein